jgi:hypothetical protein
LSVNENLSDVIYKLGLISNEHISEEDRIPESACHPYIGIWNTGGWKCFAIAALQIIKYILVLKK